MTRPWLLRLASQAVYERKIPVAILLEPILSLRTPGAVI